MITRWTFIVVLLSLGACLSARAAVIDFTIEGVVTESFRPDVSVGDPFTIRYSADPQDLDPSPTIGRYATTPATVTLPNVTFSETNEGGGNFYVDTDADRIRYISGDRIIILDTWLHFPPGTFESDELPLSLPMSTATSSSFFLIDNLGPGFPMMRGEVTSYIPEPSGMCLLVPVSVLLRRWR
jgi:hypothetical protein